jgi:hypothetical protein
MAWVTPEEALSITPGIAVSQEGIDAAQILIEIFADTTEEASDAGLISSKNLRLLKLAVAFQAAWMTAHPDQYTGSDFDTFQSDGLSVTYKNENSNILAPMARRCIKRLSWKRNRNIYIRPASGPREYIPKHLNTTNADLDDFRTDWRPLDI